MHGTRMSSVKDSMIESIGRQPGESSCEEILRELADAQRGQRGRTVADGVHLRYGPLGNSATTQSAGLWKSNGTISSRESRRSPHRYDGLTGSQAIASEEKGRGFFKMTPVPWYASLFRVGAELNL